jgi:hypothetical protein
MVCYCAEVEARKMLKDEMRAGGQAPVVHHSKFTVPKGNGAGLRGGASAYSPVRLRHNKF